jgi:hypothetical protein
LHHCFELQGTRSWGPKQLLARNECDPLDAVHSFLINMMNHPQL